MAPSMTLEDERISKIFKHLAAQGLSKKGLLESTDKEIDSLVPKHLTDVDAFILKGALRKERNIFNMFHDVVGRVLVGTDGEEDTQHGTCVLVGENGLTLTALHILCMEEQKASNKQSKKRKREKGKQKQAQIRVVFPNTTCGRMSFSGVIVHADASLDLALLRPSKLLSPKFQHVSFLTAWAAHPPLVKDKVQLFAYPLVVDREFDLPKHGKKDLPSTYEGKITLVPESSSHEVLTSYLGFGGCSGGLVIYPDSENGGCGCGIHLMSIHESDNLENWDLLMLNKIVNHKGACGVFTVAAQQFLHEYLRASQPQPQRTVTLKGRNDRAVVNKLRMLAAKGLTLQEIFDSSAYVKVPIQKTTTRVNQSYAGAGKKKKSCPDIETNDVDLRGLHVKVPIENARRPMIEPCDGGMKKCPDDETLDLFGLWPGLDIVMDT